MQQLSLPLISTPYLSTLFNVIVRRTMTNRHLIELPTLGVLLTSTSNVTFTHHSPHFSSCIFPIFRFPRHTTISTDGCNRWMTVHYFRPKIKRRSFCKFLYL